VDGNVEFVGALDKIERIDRQNHHSFTGQLGRGGALDVRVGAVTADAVRVEDADAERKVIDALMGAHVEPDIDALA
jgi:hypothetical protein